MNPYIHARTTPKSRQLIVSRFQCGWTQDEIATSLGISRRTVAKWLQRFRAEGDSGLLDRSSRPKRSPRKLAKACEEAITHLRRTFLMPAFGIASHLQLAYSTVCGYLQRHKLNRRRDILPNPTPRRYERATPGEIIHIDIKKLGRIEGIGHRMTGNRKGQSNPRSRKQGGHGWEYMHVAIDDYSRLAYSEILPDETTDSSLTFAKNAKQWFEKQGVKIQRIMTDNGVGYKKRYARILKKWEIKHITTKPYTPQTNGKAERFIRTSLNEWAYGRPYHSSRERSQALPLFLDFYNTKRQHHSIGKITPLSRVILSEQPLKT